MTLSIKNDRYAFFFKIKFIFYIIMRGAPIITNFKQPIYQTFN